MKIHDNSSIHLLFVTDYILITKLRQVICFFIPIQICYYEEKGAVNMKSQEICPRFEAAISLLGQRWTGLIIHQLMDEPKRFGQLTEEIGISGRLLSERLKNLEGDGLVERTVHPETPVRIEYSLTEKGASLQPVMKEIERWSQNWIEPAKTAESTS